MKALNFGSLNLDYVYQVKDFVQPGETMSALSQNVNCGGKGLNQSIAMSRAGARVYHGGCVGSGGERLQEKLIENQVDVTYLKEVDCIQGNAVIQVNAQGENCILLFGGSNQTITREQIEDTLECFEAGDYLILQNEINGLPYLLEKAKEKGMVVVLNPSPFTDALREIDYDAIEWLLMNEIEMEQFSGYKEPREAWNYMHEKWPYLKIIVTLGQKGSICFCEEETITVEAKRVKAVDTTAAGDTYTGYFVAGLMRGQPIGTCMEDAALASAIAVTKEGAVDSIPWMKEVTQYESSES